MKKIKLKVTLGFTLLEVIVAMTIVGMMLGSLFGLLGGSKRLAFKAIEELDETLFLRSAINLAQLLEEPEYPKSPARFTKRVALQTGNLLEKPERQTRPIILALEPYTLVDKERGLELTTVRWKKLDAVR